METYGIWAFSVTLSVTLEFGVGLVVNVSSVFFFSLDFKDLLWKNPTETEHQSH